MAATKRERRQSKREKSAILRPRRALIEVSNFRAPLNQVSREKLKRAAREAKALLSKRDAGCDGRRAA
jgi:hypothetical protein